MWTWHTEHFIAQVTAQQVQGGDERAIRSYHWQLADLMRTNQGMPRVLVEGMAGRFEDADLLVREHVAKCYDPRLGYQPFCGNLANEFTLSTGQRIDVSPFLGSRCTVTVQLPNGRREVLVGDLTVHHYRWRMRDGDQVVEVTPEHVVTIANQGPVATGGGDAPPPRTSRITPGEYSRGCTGRVGFLAGTVDHAGSPPCPVHEA